MATTESGIQPERNFFRTIGEDAQHLWNELHRHGLKRSIGRSFLELQDFYLDDQARQRLLGMRRVRRAFYLAAWLLKSLFFKLTPTRRVLFVLSVILMWSATNYQSHGRTTQISIHFPFLGIVTLLLILMLELKDKLLARDELEAGRSVQKALMPNSNPTIQGWDVWLFTRSANDVGGDLVDYIPVDGQRVGIVLGDVAGKGLPAALLMAKLQSTLRALAVDEISLEKLGERTNRILCRDGLPNRFATMVYVDVAAGSGSVRLLNCGHLPPLVLRGTRLEELPLGSMALGMLPEATFSEQAVELSQGDVLVVFSDGLTEAMNGHDEFFGDDRLRARLPSLAHMAAQGIGTQVVAAVDEFVGDAAPHDDLSLIVLRRA
ncbi:MAG TPA: PP2C family protein-serine/threonine phosphatase [Vicinamibacterales bacterium]|jgi:sigma-B regulation protein RsbU (phosphoserine phosphatase)|nr:PP2C family protein-serine/threonine phosphatase [Vicinamibacterales bacterium]